MDQHHVSTVFNEGMSFTANIDDHKTRMDTADDAGNNSGPGPKKLMLASLAGCTGIDIVSILNKIKISFSEFSIDTDAMLTNDHPRIYNEVHIIYKIKIAVGDRLKMEKAVKLSEEKYCGVLAMFRSFAKMTSTIIYL